MVKAEFLPREPLILSAKDILSASCALASLSLKRQICQYACFLNCWEEGRTVKSYKTSNVTSQSFFKQLAESGKHV